MFVHIILYGKQKKVQAYYIGLQPAEGGERRYFAGDVVGLERIRDLPFGYFSDHLVPWKKGDEWGVLRLVPYPIDNNGRSLKEDDALNQALDFLKESGFKPTVIPLEEMIESYISKKS